MLGQYILWLLTPGHSCSSIRKMSLISNVLSFKKEMCNALAISLCYLEKIQHLSLLLSQGLGT